jgi:hypothetical protein
MNARLTSYSLDRITTDHMLQIAYSRFLVTAGLVESAEAARRFADTWTSNGATVFLDHRRDEIVEMLLVTPQVSKLGGGRK